MSHFHAVVWIDHREARIFHFNADEADKLTLRAHHAVADPHFFHEVAAAVADAGEILITGPSGAKTDLVKHMAKRVPQVFSHIVGIESSDHPTDGQLLAHARHYFKAADRKISQKA